MRTGVGACADVCDAETRVYDSPPPPEMDSYFSHSRHVILFFFFYFQVRAAMIPSAS